MNMEKQALFETRKSPLKWLGRVLNPMEWIRQLGSERYRRITEEIDTVDQEMREGVRTYTPAIRESLHEARMAMKNRNYPRVIYHAWKIVETMDGIFAEPISRLAKVKQEILQEFGEEGQPLTESERAEMETALNPAAAELEMLLYSTGKTYHDLVSEAGPLEWIQEKIPTYRQMEGSLLERLFRNQMGKQKEAARASLRMAEKAFRSIKNVFSRLDSARRNPDQYIQIAEQYQKDFTDQKNEMSKLYKANFSQEVADKIDEEAKTKLKGGQGRVPDEGAPQTEEGAPQTEEGAPQTEEGAPQTEEGAPQTEGPPIPDLDQPEQSVPNSGPQSADQAEQPQDEKRKAAAAVVDLVRRAKKAALAGDRGIASALLVKASEICDDNGAPHQSITLIQAAEIILKG